MILERWLWVVGARAGGFPVLACPRFPPDVYGIYQVLVHSGEGRPACGRCLHCTTPLSRSYRAGAENPPHPPTWRRQLGGDGLPNKAHPRTKMGRRSSFPPAP